MKDRCFLQCKLFLYVLFDVYELKVIKKLFQCGGNKPFQPRHSFNSDLILFILFVYLNNLLMQREQVNLLFAILFIQYF